MNTVTNIDAIRQNVEFGGARGMSLVCDCGIS